MDRRHYLRSLAGAGVVGTAGCLGSVPGFGNENVVLGPPEQDLSEAAHPSYGDELPAVTLPDPIAGEEVSTARIFDERDRAVLLTFFYTHCPDGVCPALIQRLRRAQEVAAEEGYGDDSAFLPITFDPERDTAEVLREYATQQGVSLEAGNWHFLRPETYEAGQTLLEEKFGLVIEKAPADDYENLEYQFPHYGLILLANKRGYVERAYPNGPTVDIETVVNDFERVVTA
ncbi:SCO family protein [Halopenitus persicus]|uniref:Protein SCO1/2 n=1 Tax=Halopenitus persicus TaxID=1048396 RepID=A0A1H3EVG8_9EURY|nr:SCO family protein [Halopenitus persicus]QHS17697.1 SCO family protein [haloarchaeon 3A1-DGR]SDX82078.1 protein SCO1/2 [Halopenitus persicus]